MFLGFRTRLLSVAFFICMQSATAFSGNSCSEAMLTLLGRSEHTYVGTRDQKSQAVEKDQGAKNHPDGLAKRIVDDVLKVHATCRECTVKNVEAALKQMVKELDPNGVVLLEPVARELMDPTGIQAEVVFGEFNAGKVTVVNHFRARYVEGLAQVRHDIGRLSDAEVLSFVEAISGGGHKFEYSDSVPKTAEERRERVKNLIVILTLQSVRKALSPQEALVVARKRILEILERPMTVSDQEIFLAAILPTFDPHTGYFPSRNRNGFSKLFEERGSNLGVYLADSTRGVIINGLVKEGAAKKKGVLKRGDRILQINEHVTDELSVDEVVNIISSIPEGEKVRLRIEREGRQRVIDHELMRALDVAVSERRFDTPDGTRIVTIQFGSFEKGIAREIVETIKRMSPDREPDGVVIDLRGNGGGSMNECFKLLDYFISEGLVSLVVPHAGDIEVRMATPSPDKFKGALVVLLDHDSASASEMLATALKDHQRAIIVGSDRSYGKGVQQLYVEVPETGGYYKYTEAWFMGPGGVSPQGLGVKADIQLKGPKTWDGQSSFQEQVPGATEDFRLEADQPLSVPAKVDGMPDIISIVQNRSGARSDTIEKAPSNQQHEMQLREAVNIARDFVKVHALLNQ